MLGPGILRRGDLDGRTTRKLEDLGDIAVAGGAGAYHLGPAKVLQRHHKEFRGATGGLIGQHHQRNIPAVRIGFRHGGQVAVLIAGIGHSTAGQQRIQQPDRIGKLIAGNAAYIQQNALYFLGLQGIQLGDELVGSGTAPLGKADIGGIFTYHGRFYCGHLNGTQGQLVVVLLAILLDGQSHLGAGFAAQAARHAFIVIFGHAGAVYIGNKRPHLDARHLRRRIGINLPNQQIAGGIHLGHQTHAYIFAAAGLGIGLIFRSGEVAGIAVLQAIDIPAGNGLLQRFLIDGAVVIFPHIQVYLMQRAVHFFPFGDACHLHIEQVHRVDHGKGKGHSRYDGHIGDGRAKRNFLVHAVLCSCCNAAYLHSAVTDN